jgi:deazaflavin-dependent oxidoreductase (nitroreductase family)
VAIELPPRGTRGVEIPKPARFLMKAFSGAGSLMFRFGMKVQGRPLLRLTTVGARTGKARRAELGWFPDDDRDDVWLVVASNAGSAAHPGWAYNLAANPDQVTVDLGEGEFPVTAEILSGDERTAAWERVVTMAPGYGAYLDKTDREMPIFKLTRRDG